MRTPDTKPGKSYMPALPEEMNPELWSRLTEEQREVMMDIWTSAVGLSVRTAILEGKGGEAWDELCEKLGI